MGMLDRYKKKGGFVQLLTLIESSGKAKQDQFLSLIKQENPVWEEAIRKKSLTLEKLLSWNQIYLGEILSRIQPLTLSTALHGLPQERLEQILGCLSITERRKIFSAIEESKPSQAEINTCIMRLLTETRGFMLGGVVKMDKVDPEMAIPDNYEEILNSQAQTASLQQALKDTTAPELTPEGEPKLVFDGRGHGESKDDFEFLRKKVHLLTQENTQLKQENSQMKHKLEQIRKIA